MSLDYRVLPDPPALPVYDLTTRYGCSSDDGESDTACIRSAIADASDGGGVVFFGPGTWNLDPADIDPTHGIVVPPGVSLRGSGASSTRVVRSTAWQASAVFTLQGHNTVEHLEFVDPVDHRIHGSANTFLQLGKVPWESLPADPPTVDDVVISGNIFNNPYWAIADGNLPMNRLFVIDNEFGAFHDSLFLFGPINVIGPHQLPLPRFRVTDSVIAHNRFYPGAFQDQRTFRG